MGIPSVALRGTVGWGPSAQEVAKFIHQGVVVKLHTLEHGQSVKFPDVIGAEHHDREAFRERAELALHIEKGRDRTHGPQPRGRVTEETEWSRPVTHDIDKDPFEPRDELLRR